MNRYARQEVLAEFTTETQSLFKNAKVLVVGAGALGCPVLLYLAGAGIGTIGIADNDVVALHNLHRQVLYAEDDIDLSKAECAQKRIKALNAEIDCVVFNNFLNETNLLQIASNFDIIVDCTDNFPTRYLLNDSAVILNIPLVHASILGFEGQLSVFNVAQENESRSATYRDLFPDAPDGIVLNCAEAGVIGALPGILGSMQALEVLKLIGKFGTPLVNKMLFLNALTMNVSYLNFRKNKDTPIITKLNGQNAYCSIDNKNEKQQKMKATSVQELKKMRDENQDFVLIDVREPYEFETGNLSGILIPMNSIPERYEEIPTDKLVIVHCKAGSRSANVIAYLEQNHGFTNLSNLSGGIMAWSSEIDPSIHY
jgi:sulfur-carrier protein adenylyltransferase/sulfurtransferase